VRGWFSSGGDPGAARPRSRRVAVALGLATCAALAPLGLTLADAGRLLASLPFGVGAALLIVVLIAPAAAGFAVVLRGLPAVAADFAGRPDSEHEQIIVRVFFATVVLAYTLVLAWLFPERGGLLVAVAIAAVGGALAWILLAVIVLRPEPIAARRLAGMVLDVGSLSSFLHFGGDLTAAWYPVYLWVSFGNGFRYGLRSLLLSGALGVVGFGAVIAATPFWHGHLALSGGLMLALIILPAFVSTLIRSLTEAKAQAEQANAAKSRFLAIMSHELRTPLNTVIGMGALIERGELNPDQRDLLGTMQLAARTLLGLINDLLDFSKIEAGRFEPEVESFDLHEVAHSAIAMLRAEAGGKGLQLGLRIAPDVPATLRGWPQQLRQILINLIANAVKFTDRGRVQVTVETAARTGEAVRLRIGVRDQGIGIPEEARAKIFDLFIQADGAVTRRYGGTGLGLAIVKQLVTLMGGSVGVTRVVGRGSTYTVELPFVVDAHAAARPLDLRGRAVCVVTIDEALAGELEA
jgi:two-component system, sensor histidine kinase RpfC